MKYVCSVCGYVHEGDNPPEFCPQCKAPASKFTLKQETGDSMSFATVHGIGDGKVDDQEIMEGLHANFTGECTEVGMYLAMSRVADREGYPEIAEAYKRIAFEEAEQGACAGKFDIAKKAKQLGFDAIHDTVHEMAKDEARHGAAFAGLLKRYFKD